MGPGAHRKAVHSSTASRHLVRLHESAVGQLQPQGAVALDERKVVVASETPPLHVRAEPSSVAGRAHVAREAGVAEVAAEQERVKIQGARRPAVRAIRKQRRRRVHAGGRALHVRIVGRIARVRVHLVEERAVGDLRIRRARVVPVQRRHPRHRRERGLKGGVASRADPRGLAGLRAAQRQELTRRCVHHVKHPGRRRERHPAQGEAAAGAVGSELRAGRDLEGVQGARRVLGDEEARAAVRVQGQARRRVHASREDAMVDALVDAVLEAREPAREDGVLLPRRAREATAVHANGLHGALPRRGDEELAPRRVDDHPCMDAAGAAAERHFGVPPDRRHRVVHAARPVGLLKVEADEHAALAVARRVEGPVDGPVCGACLGIVRDADAVRRLVQHVRVEEVARLVNAALVAETVHKVAPPRPRIVQRGPHEEVRLLRAQVRVRVVVADGKVVECVPAVVAAGCGGADGVEVKGRHVDHVVVVAAVPATQRRLRRGPEPRDDGDAVVASVGDPGLLAGVRVERAALAVAPEVQARRRVERHVAGAREARGDHLHAAADLRHALRLAGHARVARLRLHRRGAGPLPGREGGPARVQHVPRAEAHARPARDGALGPVRPGASHAHRRLRRSRCRQARGRPRRRRGRITRRRPHRRHRRGAGAPRGRCRRIFRWRRRRTFRRRPRRGDRTARR